MKAAPGRLPTTFLPYAPEGRRKNVSRTTLRFPRHNAYHRFVGLMLSRNPIADKAQVRDLGLFD